MKIVKTASGKLKATLSKKEWQAIGAQAGWKVEEQEQQVPRKPQEIPALCDGEAVCKQKTKRIHHKKVKK